MAKKGKKEKKARTRKPKAEGGRKPVLEGMVERPLPIYGTYKGKEYNAMVLTSGMIKLDETEYATPSAAGRAVLGNNEKGKPLQVDGWKFWRFNEDGERVPLDKLRGAKSPLKAPEKKEEAA